MQGWACLVGCMPEPGVPAAAWAAGQGFRDRGSRPPPTACSIPPLIPSPTNSPTTPAGLRAALAQPARRAAARPVQHLAAGGAAGNPAPPGGGAAHGAGLRRGASAPAAGRRQRAHGLSGGGGCRCHSPQETQTGALACRAASSRTLMSTERQGQKGSEYGAGILEFLRDTLRVS